MKRSPEKESPEARIINRREMLLLVGATAAVSLVGCAGGQTASDVPKIVADCVVSPAQTEGPYFVDEKLNRSDIRSDPSDNSISQGVPLRLVLNVLQVTNNSCKPLPGATVDIWHCDALGTYSDVSDPHGDTRGKKFLRGYQVTDADGKVEFKTIYPGWYQGRTVHIHFMVRTNPASEVGHEFTSQLYFDESVTDQVHTQAPYAKKGRPDTRNERDGIYRRGGKQLMLQLAKDAQGYVGTYKIGFQMT
ncbi:MAG TPA: intradiol ring-cleavage dioxygenase [Pyrinomonadaceae bacterium]